MYIDPHHYRKAFQAYIRKGTPIEWAIKQERPTTHYIWRTRGDDTVRPSHAANNGRVFAWNDPPETGHPGQDYGCRCTAEPFVPSINEHINIEVADVANSGNAWTSQDFVDHYYNGGGRSVAVRETGYLPNIVAQYMSKVEDRMKNQIARIARGHSNGSFSDDFYNTYDMTGIVLSIGDTTIGGRFTGTCVSKFGILTVSGQFEFYLNDEFADPIDIGIELFGDPYPITDQWTGSFSGQVYADPSRSRFG